MKKVTLVLYVTDQEAQELLGVQYAPKALPNIWVHHVGQVVAEPADAPFGFEAWMDGADHLRIRSWFDTPDQMIKDARSALSEGKCVKFLPRREVAGDATDVA